jgi:prepilin-type N-terminal cleavage/methylation domain-containing protein
MRTNATRHSRPTRGFTLVELLVVILIILLISAAALPTVIPALNQRKITSAALILQAELARIRDAAIRANAPRGLRLVPETVRPQFAFGGPTPAYTRLIAIEPGPEYSDGLVSSGYPMPVGAFNNPAYGVPDDTFYRNLPPSSTLPNGAKRLVVQEVKVLPNGLPSNPTNWFWNVRRGDRIRFHGSGQTYTIAGPVLVKNPEDFINWGPPSPPWSQITNTNQEFLFLVNGADDNNDGYTDEGLDGLNNDQDFYPATHPMAGLPVIDPGYNSIDDDQNGLVDDTLELAYGPGGGNYAYGEYEHEVALNVIPNNSTYTILRRPVPSPGAREVALPEGIVIDMTTWNAGGTHVPERSRLPVDPLTGYCDIMISPNGQVVQSGPTSVTSQAPPVGVPYFHFWLADADDIYEPVDNSGNGVPYLLPMPMGATAYPNVNDTSGRFLKGERRLVSLNTRTGQIVTTTPEDFNATSTLTLDYPYLQAQAGVKEVP